MTETRTTSSTGGQKGVKLARFDLIPAGPLRELAEHYGRGARKYANHQWRKGYEWSKSIGALGRHFNDFMAGKDYDVCENDPTGCSFVDADGNPFEGGVTEHGSTCFNHTGSHHMVAVAWHAFLLLEFKDTHPDHDDRYVDSNVLEDGQMAGPWENVGYLDETQVWPVRVLVGWQGSELPTSKDIQEAFARRVKDLVEPQRQQRLQEDAAGPIREAMQSLHNNGVRRG